MAKKYFIRKSHSELVQEQNQLLETLLAKQEEKIQQPPQIVYTEKPKPDKEDPILEYKKEEKEEDIFEFEEDLPYIPTTSKSSANLFVNSGELELDDETVKKLKKAKSKKDKV